MKRVSEIGSDHYLTKINLKRESMLQQENKSKIIRKKCRSYRLKEENLKKMYRDCLNKYKRNKKKCMESQK